MANQCNHRLTRVRLMCGLLLGLLAGTAAMHAAIVSGSVPEPDLRLTSAIALIALVAETLIVLQLVGRPIRQRALRAFGLFMANVIVWWTVTHMTAPNHFSVAVGVCDVATYAAAYVFHTTFAIGVILTDAVVLFLLFRDEHLVPRHAPAPRWQAPFPHDHPAMLFLGMCLWISAVGNATSFLLGWYGVFALHSLHTLSRPWWPPGTPLW